MNDRQTACVVLGVGLLLLGVYFGLVPVKGPHAEGGPTSAVPFCEPLTAYERRPARVLTAFGLVLAGLATAAAGGFTTRDRR